MNDDNFSERLINYKERIKNEKDLEKLFNLLQVINMDCINILLEDKNEEVEEFVIYVELLLHFIRKVRDDIDIIMKISKKI